MSIAIDDDGGRKWWSCRLAIRVGDERWRQKLALLILKAADKNALISESQVVEIVELT